MGDEFGSGLHLQSGKDVEREVDNDETPALDCTKDSGLSEVNARIFSRTNLVAF